MQAFTPDFPEIFAADSILIPVCISNHWLLALVRGPRLNLTTRSDGQSTELFLLDTLEGTVQHNEVATKIGKWLTTRAKDEAKVEGSEAHGMLQPGQGRFNLTPASLRVNQQSNTFDCGVLTLYHTDLLVSLFIRSGTAIVGSRVLKENLLECAKSMDEIACNMRVYLAKLLQEILKIDGFLRQTDESGLGERSGGTYVPSSGEDIRQCMLGKPFDKEFGGCRPCQYLKDTLGLQACSVLRLSSKGSVLRMQHISNVSAKHG